MSLLFTHFLRHFFAVARMLVFLGTVCSPLMPAAALAQSGMGGGDAPVQVSFRVYLWPEIVDVSGHSGTGGEDGYYYKAPEIAYQSSVDGDTELVDVSSGRMSDVYRYAGSGQLVFFREEPGLDGQILRVPLGTVAADQLADEMVLIFFPNLGSEGLPYRILPVAAPTRRISDGQVMVYNLTRQKLALHAGKKAQLLEPGLVVLSEFGREADASVPLRILGEDNGEWVLRHAERQTIGNDERLLFFVFPRDSQSNRLRVLSVNTAI